MLLLLAGPALAAGTFSSTPQHVTLIDEVNVFEATEIDSGYLPSGSPLQVRFAILGAGTTSVVMEGDADLFWPTDLNLAFTPEAGSGELEADTWLEAVTTVKVDVFGISWEQVIDSRALNDVTGRVVFDPFVLDDSTTTRVELTSSEAATELIDYSLDIFAGIGLTFKASLGPRATIGMEGLGWQTADQYLSSAAGTLTFAAAGQPEQEVAATFQAIWDNLLSLVITPEIYLDAGWLGSYRVARFEIPIDLSHTSFVQDFPTTTLRFPLPVMRTALESYDFGELQVGELRNLNLAIANDGLLDLEGETGLTGSPYFSLYPNYFQAGPGREDGVVVTFAPESAGEFEARLLLSSNDPSQPIAEVLLVGRAVEPPVEEAEDTGGSSAVIPSEVGGCGCASARAGGPWPLLLGLLGLFGLRRRAAGR